MSEPWSGAPKDEDLSEDERRLLDRLRRASGEQKIDAVEDTEEVEQAIKSDTVVDPRVMPAPDREPPSDRENDGDG